MLRKSSTSVFSNSQQWRPGFWTGAATGAAAGYVVGERESRQNTNRLKEMGPVRSPNRRNFSGGGRPSTVYGGGEYPSIGSSSPTPSTSRSESMISRERRGVRPHHEPSGRYIIPLHAQAACSVDCGIPVFISVCSVLMCRCLMKAPAAIATGAMQVYMINIFLRLPAKASSIA